MITPLQNRQARAAMKAQLRTESELDQLIIDHFSEVRRLIPTGWIDLALRIAYSK